ncbi:uncharacterized protein LOC107366565 [Tetranychus urticae]|uniref:uncharacterized protein LOC107366565 n=1 Tax=Tetranychus urticae TaxID=32264 RepID=UPI00077BC991|nr:uncharacterized protein LOC107366565 [Tetranychus urticae]
MKPTYDEIIRNKMVKVTLLEWEKKILDSMSDLIMEQCEVMEERCRVLFAQINAVNERENNLTEALGSYNHRLNECRRKIEKIQDDYKKFLEDASNAIAESKLLDEETAEKQAKLLETIQEILCEEDEPYEPTEDWLKSEEKLQEWYNEQRENAKEFYAKRAAQINESVERLQAVLPSKCSQDSQSPIESDYLHDIIPED